MFGVDEEELTIFLGGDEVEAFIVRWMEVFIFERDDRVALKVNDAFLAIFLRQVAITTPPQPIKFAKRSDPIAFNVYASIVFLISCLNKETILSRYVDL